MDIVAITAATTAELKEFTNLLDWSTPPPAIRDAVVELRGANGALDALAAQVTHVSTVANPSAPFLPGDVLYEIFRTWVLLGDDRMSSRIPFAFTAASVNKHWRSVALQFGSLWATLTNDFDHTIYLEEHIDNVLERSQGYPLDLTIRKAPLTFWSFGPSSDRLARLLSASRIVRCSVFSPSVDSYDFDESVLAMFQMELPLAETIICSGYDHDYVLPMSVQLFTLSPKLGRLEMHNIPLDVIDWSLVPHLTAFATQRWMTEYQLRTISTLCPSAYSNCTTFGGRHGPMNFSTRCETCCTSSNCTLSTSRRG